MGDDRNDEFLDPGPRGRVPPRTLAEVQQDHVLRVLAECGGNKVRAATILGVCSKTVYNLLNRWGLP